MVEEVAAVVAGVGDSEDELTLLLLCRNFGAFNVKFCLLKNLFKL